MTGFETATDTTSEEELLQTAREALSRCNWVVGQCAAEWTERYSRGRTDADFADLVGLSHDQVFQRRRVWEVFGQQYEDYSDLKWSHFYVAINWEDASECLHWAAENSATLAEMRAWRRATHGEDLSEPAEEISPLADDPNMAPLGAVSSDVRSPDDDVNTWSEGGRARSESNGDDVPFAPTTASSANREVDGDDYAPFRRDAGSPPGETREEPAEEKPAEQIARRVITTLERISGVLAPAVVTRFRTLPAKDRRRLIAAARQISERLAVLEE